MNRRELAKNSGEGDPGGRKRRKQNLGPWYPQK